MEETDLFLNFSQYRNLWNEEEKSNFVDLNNDIVKQTYNSYYKIISTCDLEVKTIYTYNDIEDVINNNELDLNLNSEYLGDFKIILKNIKISKNPDMDYYDNIGFSFNNYIFCLFKNESDFNYGVSVIFEITTLRYEIMKRINNYHLEVIKIRNLDKQTKDIKKYIVGTGIVVLGGIITLKLFSSN